MLEGGSNRHQPDRMKGHQPGEQAALRPEPQTGFTNGLPAVEREASPSITGSEAIQAIGETAIIEAQHNPNRSRSFALASYGRRDPRIRKRLRATFAEGIPLEFLSHYESGQHPPCVSLYW